MFKTRGGGVKGRLNNVKKIALLAKDGFPYQEEKWGCRGHCMQRTPSQPGATICGGLQVAATIFLIFLHF